MDLSCQFGGVYRNRRVLLTGHTGFKGSWLALWLSALGARLYGAALAPDTDPAHWTALGLREVSDHRVDVANADALAAVVREAAPDIIFHLAAQPLVRRGHREPQRTFATNVMGTVNLLEAARATTSVRSVVVVTTDKVYADEGHERPHVETDRLGGHDPYAASKACAELVVDAYRHSYFASPGAPRIATARSGNVIGGGDWSEDRLVPDCVRALGSDDSVVLRYPDSVRPWQHVLDASSGYLLLGAALLGRESPADASFNFGPSFNDPITVRDLVGRLQSEWPALKVDTGAAASPVVETGILRLDNGRARRQLGWSPVWNTERAIKRTARWYANYVSDGTLLSTDDLEAYSRDAEEQGVAWASASSARLTDAAAADGE